MRRGELTSAMNATKWDELRLLMHGLPFVTEYQVTHTNGHLKAAPDSEWFYHFPAGGTADILHVDISPRESGDWDALLEAVRSLRLPAALMDQGVRVFGYIGPGQSVSVLD